MPSFGNRSLANLKTCHVDLQKIFSEVVWTIDCTIVEGHRGQEKQDLYYDLNKSEIKFPNGKHNSFPSMAADVMRYYPDRPHLHWTDKDDMEWFAKFVIDTAQRLYAAGEITHLIRWGADWDMDGVRVDKDPDEGFFDGPHFELYMPKEK
jgi:peptidoglycan LD-endopeptidase CwlK